MKVICRGRQTGKTTELIRMSAKTGIPIGVYNQVHFERILEIARDVLEQGAVLPTPFVITRKTVTHWSTSKIPNKIYLDDAEMILQTLLGNGIEAITLSDDEPTESLGAWHCWWDQPKTRSDDPDLHEKLHNEFGELLKCQERINDCLQRAINRDLNAQYCAEFLREEETVNGCQNIAVNPSGSLRVEKSPLGLIPKWIRDEQRRDEIREAIQRYTNGRKPIPPEWVEEYNDLAEKGK